MAPAPLPGCVGVPAQVSSLVSHLGAFGSAGSRGSIGSSSFGRVYYCLVVVLGVGVVGRVGVLSRKSASLRIISCSVSSVGCQCQ